jgi:DNA invertase Pin-like site-specific DNA recombinase
VRTRKGSAAAENRKTVGYIRVSTEDQVREGVSLAAQEARIGAYCVAMGFDVSEVISDAGESARSLSRPGIERVMAEVRAGRIGRVVVLKLDRLTRSVGDLAELLKLFAKVDAALVSVTEHLDTASASGELMLNVMTSVAQWERRAIGERTAEVLAQKRRTRTAYGSTPFGFVRVGDALIPDPREQDALKEAVHMTRAGATFREIAVRLTELGVMPHRAKVWHTSSVRAMLRSKMATEAVA